jgi:hypothetical protein
LISFYQIGNQNSNLVGSISKKNLLTHETSNYLSKPSLKDQSKIQTSYANAGKISKIRLDSHSHKSILTFNEISNTHFNWSRFENLIKIEPNINNISSSEILLDNLYISKNTYFDNLIEEIDNSID